MFGTLIAFKFRQEMFASKSFGWLSGSLAAAAEKTDCRSALFLALLSLASRIYIARRIAFSSVDALFIFHSYDLVFELRIIFNKHQSRAMY